MKYVQIRISKYSCLDEVLEDISRKLWLKIKRFLSSGDDASDYDFGLQKLLTCAVNSRVHKYPNCGLTEACHDEIEGSPWMDYDEKIYMLSLDNDIEGFINDVAYQIVNSLDNQLPIKRRVEISSVILRTLRHEFGKYLYFNPVCRTIFFCELQL